MKTKPEYKLSIVTKKTYQPAGSKQSVTTESEVVVIGYFKTERDLQNWAEDNLGEINNE